MKTHVRLCKKRTEKIYVKRYCNINERKVVPDEPGPVSAADDGHVYKMVEWYDARGVSHSALLDIFEVTAPRAIRQMALSRRVRRPRCTVSLSQLQRV